MKFNHRRLTVKPGQATHQILLNELFKYWKHIKVHYYSFRIFSQFWLAKSTRIIHHNQLLMTKFGRILCLTRKWHQKCSLLQLKSPLAEKTWERDWVVFLVKTKVAGTSLVSRVRTTAGTTVCRQNYGWKHGKNSKKTTRRATSAIWRIFAELDKPKRKIKLYVFKPGIILNE